MTHALLSHGQMCLVWSNVNVIFFWVSDTLCNTITHTLLSRLLSADWFRAGTMHAVTRTLRGGTEVFSHWRSLYSYFFYFLFLVLLCPFAGNLGRFTWVWHSSLGAVLPISVSVCGIFMSPNNSKYGLQHLFFILTCAQMLMLAITHGGGMPATESLRWKLTLGETLRHLGLEPA